MLAILNGLINTTGMRHNPDERYMSAGEGKCWEMFHPGLNNSPHCMEEEGHEGDHQGANLSWPEEPQVDAETALEFLNAYRPYSEWNSRYCTKS